MTKGSFHLNLLSQHERRSSSPIRAKILLPILSGIIFGFILLWAGFVGIQLVVAKSQAASLRKETAKLEEQHSTSETLKLECRNLQAQVDQFDYYTHGQCKRGELLNRLAFTIPDGITLSSLSIPEQPPQNLQSLPGSKLPPPQGPTQNVEQVELRIVGLANSEHDLFNMMEGLKGESFTGMVEIVEKSADPNMNSPRVVEFRQEAPSVINGRQALYFDIVYRLKAREFVK